MPRLTWLRLVLILLVIIGATYLAQGLLQFLSGFSSILLILILAGLVAYALEPLVQGLQSISIPTWRPKAGAEIATARTGGSVYAWHPSRPMSVAFVYLSLVILVIIVVAAFIPATLAQVNEIAPRLNSIELVKATLLNVTQEILGRLNITTDAESLVGNLVNGLQTYATPLLQNTASVLAGVLSVLGNVVLVILFSFFLAMDGPRFISKLLDAMPGSLRQETRVLIVTIDHAVGGFLRSQLLQAVAVGVTTGMVMTMFGVQGALVAALFAGLMMLIPLVGPLFALIPPLLATLLTAPEQLFWVIIPLFVFTAILVNAIIPRIVGKALGLHPLVVIVSLLLGFQVGGFWGAFFAVPVAGIFFTFGAFLLGRRQRLTVLADNMVQMEPTDADKSALDTAPLPRETILAPAVQVPHAPQTHKV